MSMWAAIRGIALSASTLLAQDTYKYSSFDIADGKRLFLSSCAGCHGPDGDAVAGTDLGHGKFRRSSSDDELVRIIRTGIPNTGMPSNELSNWEASIIIAYLRSIALSASSQSAPGDPARGKTIFEVTGRCLDCHRVQDKGSRLGPDLSEIGARRRAAELERSVLDPDAEILPSNRSFRVVTREGTSITGRLLNHDPFTVQMIDSKERLRSFLNSDLREYSFVDKSPMPSYRGKLSAGELADLVRYLVSLKGLP